MFINPFLRILFSAFFGIILMLQARTPGQYCTIRPRYFARSRPQWARGISLITMEDKKSKEGKLAEPPRAENLSGPGMNRSVLSIWILDEI